MAATTLVPSHIAEDLRDTLTKLREARVSGDLCAELVTEAHLNRLLDRTGRLIQRLNERSTNG